jgi:cyclin-dependent kinase-like
VQGELVDGEPLFPGESDIDQLYRIQQLLGPLIPGHRARFEMHPAHANISFSITEPYTLARRYEGRVSVVELDFLTGLLHLDPRKRLDGAACLRHAYLRELAEADEEVHGALEAQA